MKICAIHTTDPCILYAALLHDVLEDTSISLEKLQAFLESALDIQTAERTLGIVVELTDIYTKASFPQWNRGKRRRKEEKRLGQTSAAAQTIKYADIIDNCEGILKADPDFGPKFLRECDLLLDHMQKGISSLYEKARTAVKNEWTTTHSDKQYSLP